MLKRKSLPTRLFFGLVAMAIPEENTELECEMRNRISLILLPLLLAVASYSFGQASQGMPHRYDPATEVTVTGSVEEVLHPNGPNGMIGTHVTLKTDSGVMDIHIGPEMYISKQGFTIQRGDTLSVIGSKQIIGGKEALIAKEVKKGDKVLTLRDANGIPKWSGRRAASN